jgi:glutathione peroxidase
LRIKTIVTIFFFYAKEDWLYTFLGMGSYLHTAPKMFNSPMMKIQITLLIFLQFFSFSTFAKSIYDFKLKSLDGRELNLKSYKGKAVVVVNITGNGSHLNQLTRLEKIYQEFRQEGLIIIGLASNDFGDNIPQSVKQLQATLNKHSVTFPITEFMAIKKNYGTKFSQYLEDISTKRLISWDFTKFIFNRKGQYVNRYSTTMSVASTQFKKDIKKALATK